MIIDSSIAAIVTGAASGLGAATVRALAARGARVALFDLDAERGEAIASELGGTFCRVNVTDADSVVAGFARARAVHGQERIMVNCAGIAPSERLIWRDRETGAIRTHRVEELTRALDINLVGTFRCAMLAVEGMAGLDPVASGERGVIVNTGSISGEDGQGRGVAYAASKAGVAGLTLAMARGLAPEGIRINTIHPGLMNTALMAGVPQEMVDKVASQIPFPKRLGEAEEFSDLVTFLVGNAYMNGAVIRMDGAMRLP